MLDFDLRDAVEDTTEMLAVKAEEKGLELVCLIDPEVPLLLRGDPGRLRQILANLGSNAIKFTPRARSRSASPSTEKTDAKVNLRFEVRDTGIGIPKDKLTTLFSPFTQVDGSTTRKYGGTGLGLSISKQLAELMGGRIGVESEEGKGSTFWFSAVLDRQPGGSDSLMAGELDGTRAPVADDHVTNRTATAALPQGRRDAGGPSSPPPPRAGSRVHARVLVTEDNITNQLVAVKILEKLGYRADVAANGEEAVKALRSISYDLVFMDCQMPEMDGFVATGLIRRGEAGTDRASVPIIAMTARAMQGDREKCLEAGMNDYVSKQVDPAALAKALERWLTRKSDIAGGLAGVGKGEAVEPPPVFDKDGLNDRLMGDQRAHIGEILSLFLEDIPRRIETLKGYVAAGNAASAQDQAHAIKGAAASVGGEALRAVAFEMEKAGRAGDVEKARAIMPLLERGFEQLRQAVRG